MRIFAFIIFFTLLAASAPSAQAAAPGPYVTFLFSRTEEQPAQNCVPDAIGGAPLTTTVAPYLTSLGLTATGTVNTVITGTTDYCTHNGESLASSWSELQVLAGDGWEFTPHEYDSAAKVASLTSAQAWQVTCGQAQTLTTNGLGPGDGMISYPGAQKLSTAIVNLQTQYGQNCFGWGRSYHPSGITTPTDAAKSPFWQHTMALKGGPGTGSPAYTDPQTVITEMQSLQPGQWLTIQVYLLVTGTNPPGDTITWNCASTPHTSSDVERYCYTDAQAVFQAAASLQAAGKLTVTDPLTVAVAFGRPATYGMPKP